MIEKYDSKTILIRVPREKVSWDMLIISLFFLMFFILGELLTLGEELPLWLFAMPLPLLLMALIAFNQWLKWFRWGQIVGLRNNKLEIIDSFLGLFSIKRSYDIRKIKDFELIPFTVYRSGGSFSYGETTKGFCVRVIFMHEKLFWFIEKDRAFVTIGGYLDRAEAMRLRDYLKEYI